MTQIKDLKAIISETVTSWGGRPEPTRPAEAVHPNLRSFEGHWIDTESGSHFFGRIVNGELVVPYGYVDSNELTAFFYAWESLNEHWFTRFAWLDVRIRGLAFCLSHNGTNTLALYAPAAFARLPSNF